mgnify:CR=1 FL=1
MRVGLGHLALRALHGSMCRSDWAQCADLGEWNDVHPLEKKTLGRRVATKMKTLLKAAK